MKRFIVALATLLSLASPARGQNYLTCQVNGIVTTCPADVRLKTGAFIQNAYVNWASPGALGSGTATTVRGTTITATTQFSGSGAGLTSLPAASITGSLSGVTIDCASNTCSNIANAALVNSSITVTAGTGLSGGGVVSLGGTVSLTLPSVGPGAGAIAYPASITLDAQGRVSAASAGSAPAPATRTITAGTGLTGGGDLSADRTLAIAATTVSAASYPTSGQIPTFTVNAQGQLTTAGSTTTLTGPAISGPTLSGTLGGTYTIGGTPTLGVNLAFGSFKGTGLAAGSAAGDTGRWEQLGVAGPTFYLNTGQSFVANGYVGIAGDGSSTLVVNVVPWVVPVSCTLRNVRVFGFANTSGSVVFTIYKATAALSPSYSATAVTCTLTNTFSCTDTTHSVSLSAGELVVGFTGSSWAANGASITSQCIPN